MAEIDYACEKMTAAIHGMAYSTLSIQDRLHHALIGISPLGSQHFPTDELRAAWEGFHSTVTAIHDPEEGSFRATTRQMTDDEAADATLALINLLSRSEGHRQDLRR